MFEAVSVGVLMLESESLPVPPTRAMEVPPVEVSESLPVLPNMLTLEPPI